MRGGEAIGSSALHARFERIICSYGVRWQLARGSSRHPREVLESRRALFEVVAIGGGSLLLLGVIQRPTKDLDILALLEPSGMVTAQPIPEVLRQAAADVAATLGLAPDWLNGGPTQLLEFGLPDGFSSRMSRRDFGGLIVHLAGRRDQICFKFYAAVDQGPRSKHVQDLRKLAPSHEELLDAARWARTHDPSEGFRVICIEALTAFGVGPLDDV